MSGLTYAGKPYRLSVDNGVVFLNAYSPDGTTLHAAEAAPGVFLLGWEGEKSGMTVTHAMNLNTLTFQAYWAYDISECRIGELHVGTLEEV